LYKTSRTPQEAMRLYPAAWSIGRIAIEDVEIGGHLFKKGESVMMSQYAVHRDPQWFDQPDAFIPERFETDLLKKIPSYAYFPFGGPGTVVEPEPLITLHPKNLMMQITNDK
jgi:cytochrome P450